MSVCKDYMFRVGAFPRPHGPVRIVMGGRPPLEVATPVEFHNGLPGYWTPEDMLVGAVASCYVLTFRALAGRRAVPFGELEVSGAGHVTRRADGDTMIRAESLSLGLDPWAMLFLRPRVVRADLDDTPAVEDDDLVGIANGREPVRDRDRRPAL